MALWRQAARTSSGSGRKRRSRQAGQGRAGSDENTGRSVNLESRKAGKQARNRQRSGFPAFQIHLIHRFQRADGTPLASRGGDRRRRLLPRAMGTGSQIKRAAAPRWARHRGGWETAGRSGPENSGWDRCPDGDTPSPTGLRAPTRARSGPLLGRPWPR